MQVVIKYGNSHYVQSVADHWKHKRTFLELRIVFKVIQIQFCVIVVIFEIGNLYLCNGLAVLNNISGSVDGGFF